MQMFGQSGCPCGSIPPTLNKPVLNNQAIALYGTKTSKLVSGNMKSLSE